jgi:hypothetical protein
MADQLQLRGGTTTEHSTFTGALREVTVDTDKDTLVVHDNATAGGYPLMRENGSNSALALGSATAPSIKFTGDTNTGIFSPGANQVAVTTGGTERLTIDSSGNVGIGTDIPADTLDIQKNATSAAAAGLMLKTADGNGSLLTLGVSTSLSSASIASLRTGTGIVRPLTFIVGTNSADERMRIDTSGNVGIGDNAPDSKLTVFGGAVRSKNVTSDAGFDFQENGSAALIRQRNNRPIVFYTNNLEAVRIDSSGRLLVGTSTSASSWSATALEIIGTTTNGGNLVIGRDDTAIAVDNNIGTISFWGNDSSGTYEECARITADADLSHGEGDKPTRLVFHTTADGAASPTERQRITSNGVLAYNQSAPISKSAAATLTVAELQNGIIQYTGAAATLTLPTGTLTEGGFAGIYTNLTFEWSVINTGSGLCTIGGGTAHTIVGGATIAAGASGRFASRRTAANTFVSYRLS